MLFALWRGTGQGRAFLIRHRRGLCGSQGWDIKVDTKRILGWLAGRSIGLRLGFLQKAGLVAPNAVYCLLM